MTIMACVFSVIISILFGERYAEDAVEFIDPLKGITVVGSVVGLITFVASSINTYTWTIPTTVSSVDQLEQIVIDSIQILVVFILNWIQNLLVSLPLGIVVYTATYLATSLREQSIYYYS